MNDPLPSQAGFNGGQPIDDAFFKQFISGQHNPYIMQHCFPDWTAEQQTAFYRAKEERYRTLAAGNLQPLEGLLDLAKWVSAEGIRTAAVTNAPREVCLCVCVRVCRCSGFIVMRSFGARLGCSCQKAFSSLFARPPMPA